ncbi:MAG: hypothetical protein ABJF01_20385 [bacterium]
MKSPTNLVTVMHAAARIGVLLACAATLGACASIPQRAWRNGEAMSQSRAFQSVLGGNMSMESHRALQTSLDPLRLNYREVAYPAFGHWW